MRAKRQHSIRVAKGSGKDAKLCCADLRIIVLMIVRLPRAKAKERAKGRASTKQLGPRMDQSLMVFRILELVGFRTLIVAAASIFVVLIQLVV